MGVQNHVVAPEAVWPSFASLVPSGELSPQAADVERGIWKDSSQYSSSPRARTGSGLVLWEKEKPWP